MPMNAGNEADDRVDLIDKARTLAGPNLEHKGATTRQVMERALLAAGVKDKLDGKSDEYVEALFDAHAHLAKNGSPAKRADSASGRVYRQDGSDGPVDICERARQIMIEQSRDAWKAPLGVFPEPTLFVPPVQVRADASIEPSDSPEEDARRQARLDSEEAWKKPLTPPARVPSAFHWSR